MSTYQKKKVAREMAMNLNKFSSNFIKLLHPELVFCNFSIQDLDSSEYTQCIIMIKI